MDEDKVSRVAGAETRDPHETWYLAHGNIERTARHKGADGYICIITVRQPRG